MRARQAVGGDRQRLLWRGLAGVNDLMLASRMHSVSTDFPGLLFTSEPRRRPRLWNHRVSSRCGTGYPHRSRISDLASKAGYDPVRPGRVAMGTWLPASILLARRTNTQCQTPRKTAMEPMALGINERT